MIVRILGEGQWRIEDGRLDALNELDDRVEKAVEAGDEAAFAAALGELLAAVRRSGDEVGLEELIDSDLILPPSDASIAEVRDLLSDDGLIPG
jgi:hypothetical protein